MTSTQRTPRTIDPMDLAGIDDLLSNDELAVRSSVRQLCDKRIDPFVADWFERGEVDDIRGLARDWVSWGCWACTCMGTGARA